MSFHDELQQLMDGYVHGVYKATRHFPKDELYGVVSQLRRASLSVVLNYIEGYARGRSKVYKNFLEISYGSLKESGYLLDFSLAENYLQRQEHEELVSKADRIGKMLWGVITKL